MKFLHTADLHIGKKIFERSLIEDQKCILAQIYDIALKEQVNAVLIAGDIYDRAVPSTEAVELLDDFLTKLQAAGIPVLMISGNHDSPERVSFADAILEQQGIYIAGSYRESLKTVTIEDEYGPVTFVLMPFVKPAVVGASYPAEVVKSVETVGSEGVDRVRLTTSAEAVEYMLSRTPMTLSLRQRYVLMTHYFVVGDNGEVPELSDSETDINVGGLDSVPASYFTDFCYVALGHIHKPQHIGKGEVYYSGSPLKYSFSEAKGYKSVNLVELDGNGVVSVRREALKPLHEMRCIKGRLADLMNPEIVGQADNDREDYIQATLTDTEELIDPIGTLRSVYPNVLQIILEKNVSADGAGTEYESRLTSTRKGIEELFGEFYELLKGEPMDEKRRAVVEEILCDLRN